MNTKTNNALKTIEQRSSLHNDLKNIKNEIKKRRAKRQTRNKKVKVIEIDELYLIIKIYAGEKTNSGTSWSREDEVEKTKFQNKRELKKYLTREFKKDRNALCVSA